ncbi:MAG: STAS domain-containing protein [Chromatiaceae bacterium]|nr:STAS domain-containing protein [Gammaproteobacteria bacterium]MCP5414638.1 STAS domain-containing protein [Chromatiaceae bacterium]MCP5421991.1 STAS domain-containing protein [Chromatiaceae bacterium]
MAITTTESGDGRKVTIHVAGRFDFASHQDFMRAYKQHARGEKVYVVDLKNTDYMDSSAMGMLLQLRDYAAKGHPMELVNSNDGVREILRIANFDKIFKVA